MVASSSAQALRLGRWDGSLETDVEVSRQETRTKGAERQRFDRARSDEKLTIRNSGGFIYHPRLATFSLGATVGFDQDRLTFDGDERSDDTVLYGYDAFVSLLPDQPLSLDLFTNRLQTTSSQEFAGETHLVTEARGGTLFVRRLYIPSTFTLRQERQKEDSIFGSVLTRRDDRRTTLRYEGQRGWVDQEMRLLYEFIDDHDEVFPRLSFQSHEVQASYSVDFGEELNRHWDSRARYMTRSGFFPSTFLSVDEALRIEHSDRLQTNYHYLFLLSEAGETETATHTASASLSHRLWDSVTTRVAVDGTHQTLTGGEKDTAGPRTDVTYTKRLPLDGRLTVSTGGGARYEDDRFRDSETPISNEIHTVAMPLALPVALANPFVVPSSIAVTKTATAPVLAGCLVAAALPAVLTAGIDYDVQTRGDVTEIVPRACTSTTLGINPGDTIAVDYQVTVARALTFATTTWHAGASVDFRWARVFVRHEQLDQALIAGRRDDFLDNTTTDTLGAELRYPGTAAHASLTGEARRFRGRRTAYDSLRVGLSADALLRSDLTGRVSADRTVTTFTEDHRKTRSLSLRAGLSWVLRPTLSLEASAGLQRLDDTLQATQEVREARLFARWMFRKVEITPMFQYFGRRYGSSVNDEYRFTLRMIRRF